MNTQTKPFASLTNQEVHEIVTDLDNKILDASRSRELFKDLDDKNYSMYLAKEVAYMECRNLILSKL